MSVSLMAAFEYELEKMETEKKIQKEKELKKETEIKKEVHTERTEGSEYVIDRSKVTVAQYEKDFYESLLRQAEEFEKHMSKKFIPSF